MTRHPLDRAVWNALSTQQQAFGVGDARSRRFRHDIGPLAGGRDGSADAVASLAELAIPDDDISLLEPTPPAPPPGVTLELSAICLQMTIRAFTAARGGDVAFDKLGDADAADMQALAELTNPGPYRARTHTLGRFLGVREHGVLIAMAGERMRLDGFVEISAVCTHPDHQGHGLAAALMRAVGARILAEGATPFLHSYASNTGAVALYRKLGFEVRAEVTHAVWRRA